MKVLRPQLGPVEIEELEQLKGGYSREMWSFDAICFDGVRMPLILCVDSDTSVVGADADALDRVREAELLRTLRGARLPVPDVYAAGGADGPLGRPFFVMERCDGSAAVAAFRRDPWYVEHLDDLGRQLAEILSSIHQVEVDELVLGPRPTPETVAEEEVARWRAELLRTPQARTPAVDRAVSWLAATTPPVPARVVLVHGDFRIGNILHGPDGMGGHRLGTVLDWEMAHYGDPLEDVAWAQLVCWRVGTGKVGGLVPLDRWAQLYASASGAELDAEALRFWEVLGSVKMACLLSRAAAAVTEQAERALLERLLADLDHELETRLLPHLDHSTDELTECGPAGTVRPGEEGP